MQIINNTNGLFENIYFKNTTIDKSIKNHKELLEIIIPKCSKLLIASPFLMDSFESFFKNISIENIEFELITTCNPKRDELTVKPFQIKNFGMTIKKLTSKYPDIHLINKLHSKIYLFYKDNSIVLGIVTSANFTNNGLSENHETGVVLSDNKILKSLELDIKKNLDFINLSESQIDDLCIVASRIKQDKPSKKQENIPIDLSKYFDQNYEEDREKKNSNLNDNLNNNDVFIDKNKEFNFEEFISKQILQNNQIDTIDVSNLDINLIPTSINKLTELRNINISNNHIRTLPDELFSLTKLETLNISNNDIKLIPEKIKDLRTYPKNFHKLVIYGNEDLKIDIGITWIKSFKTIVVDKLIINQTLLIFKIFRDANVQIIDKDNNNLHEYIEYCNDEIINDKTNILENKYNKNIIKTCSLCKKELGLDKFYNSDKHSGKNNYYPHCKDCDSEEGRNKERQANYIIRRLYEKKLVPQMNKKHLSIPYAKDEFVDLIENQQLFKELYEEYKNNDYNSDLKPSLYLVDKQIDYSLENIQICTSQEANKRYGQSLMTNYGESTIQLTLDREPIQIYISAQEARKAMNLKGESIINCCNGKLNTAANYKWKYLKDIKDSTTLEKIEKIKKVNQCYVDDEDFLLDIVDNKDLEDYLKVILYFKNYEDQEIKELIKEALLSNTKGYLLELFKKDTSELIKEFKNNYSKIEAEYFDYLYGFVNIRYTENEDIPILKILKIIAKNTISKQLIEFLMENKTKEEIFISIIENTNKKIGSHEYLINLEFIEKRIIKYYLNSNYTELAKKILQREELKTPIIQKVIAKVGEEQVKNTVMSTTYLKTSTNKWIIDNFTHYERKQDIIDVESAQKAYLESKKNDDILKELLVEFRNSEINKKFVINEKCILSDKMIEQFLNYKPINKEEFTAKISFKLRNNIEPEQMLFIDEIFEILEMANE